MPYGYRQEERSLESITVPEVGQLVDVRRRRFVVTDVKQGMLPPDPCMSLIQRPHHLTSLSSVEDDALGEELTVIWELEPGARVHENSQLPRPDNFDPPQRLDAFLNAVRWGAVAPLDQKILLAPFRSGITIEEYQLDPLVRALQMPRVNILIADDVGLGKTIEAGLIIQELTIRHRVRTALIVCPSSLQIQWQEQMRDKFGLDFQIVDSEFTAQLRRRRGLNANPWSSFPRLITSIDFLKRERPLRLFRELLPVDLQPTYPRSFDLLLVDEAHNIAPNGGERYATDSLRTAAMRLISPHFEHKLFLSATPHNGNKTSFTGLLELLDDQRFARGIDINPDSLAQVMVRRLKSDLRDELPPRPNGTKQFPHRSVDVIEVPYTPREHEIYQLLRQYTLSRRQNCADRQEEYATEFVMKLLKKRLISSPQAFAITLQRHVESINKSKRPSKSLLQRPSFSLLKRELEDFQEDSYDEDQYEEAEEDSIVTAARLFSDLSDNEHKLLRKLAVYCESETQRADSKAQSLIQWLNTHIKKDGDWTDERVIIFTEYRATQNWLLEILASHGFAQGARLATIYGGMDDDERQSVKAAFQTTPSDSPVRILLATDAASEGIDLQNHCCRLIHYEIPWNPNRLEQRNGRIDRHGQKSPQAFIYHFVGKGYTRIAKDALSKPVGDLDGDLEFLARVVNKVEQIREDLGKVGPVISQQLQEVMLGKISRLDTTKAERDSEQVRKTLKVERKLREQIGKFRDQLDETIETLHLTGDAVRQVIEVGLDLARQPSLKPTTLKGLVPLTDSAGKIAPVFEMPQMAGTWALCTEGLSHPHTRKIRPITFDETLTRDRDDIVLVHLNHRLAQICLRILRAEVWSPEGHRKLQRFSMRRIPRGASTHPVLVAYGRVVTLGATMERLHEEVIMAGGLLEHGRFVKLGVTELHKVTKAALPVEVSESLQKQLQTCWSSFGPLLLKALESRMAERAKSVLEDLAKRELKAIRDTTDILQELSKHIQAELDKIETVETDRQLSLWESVDERNQFRLDRNSLRLRLDRIPQELENETKQIRQRFADPNARLFPVAVECLVPEDCGQI